MTCKLCGNSMLAQETSFCACDALPPVKFENVPAHVCEVCGEKVFSREAVERIQQLAESGVNFRTVGMRIFDYATMDQLVARRGYQIVHSVGLGESLVFSGTTGAVVLHPQAMDDTQRALAV